MSCTCSVHMPYFKAQILHCWKPRYFQLRKLRSQLVQTDLLCLTEMRGGGAPCHRWRTPQTRQWRPAPASRGWASHLAALTMQQLAQAFYCKARTECWLQMQAVTCRQQVFTASYHLALQRRMGPSQSGSH